MPKSRGECEILQQLAERLPDHFLHELFPQLPPQEVRDTLRRIAGRTKPAERKATAPTLPFAQPGRARAATPQPAAGSCILYADGASRGNPGEAGAGVVLLDGDRRELDSRALYLGQCTNNAAEYQALIAGLELALNRGCERLSIFLDSELIVRQISGAYKVKNAQLQPLYLQARGLLQRLRSWRIQHVPRAENARADRLANQGIDEKTAAGADGENTRRPGRSHSS